MKKLLLLFIPLMFFFGCEEEEESANLDSNLFGAWKVESCTIDASNPNGPPIGLDLWVFFNQDGTFGGVYGAFEGDEVDDFKNNIDGDWWVDGDLLIFDYGDGNLEEWQNWSVGDTLRQYMEFPVCLYSEEYDEFYSLQEEPPYYYDWIKQWD